MIYYDLSWIMLSYGYLFAYLSEYTKIKYMTNWCMYMIYANGNIQVDSIKDSIDFGKI